MNDFITDKIIEKSKKGELIWKDLNDKTVYSTIKISDNKYITMNMYIYQDPFLMIYLCKPSSSIFIQKIDGIPAKEILKNMIFDN